MRKKQSLAAAITAILALSACGKAENPARLDAKVSAAAIPAAASKAVTDHAQAELNAAWTQIRDLTASLAAVGRTTPDQLVISLGGDRIPVDRWLWSHGLIELVGVAYGQPVFSLTKAGHEFSVSQPPWFVAATTSVPTGTCKLAGGLSNLTCSVFAHIRVTKSPAGQAVMGKEEVPEFDLARIASSDAGVWSVTVMPEQGQGLQDIAAQMLLGPSDGREAAQADYIKQLEAKAVALAAEPTSTEEYSNE